MKISSKKFGENIFDMSKIIKKINEIKYKNTNFEIYKAIVSERIKATPLIFPCSIQNFCLLCGKSGFETERYIILVRRRKGSKKADRCSVWICEDCAKKLGE